MIIENIIGVLPATSGKVVGICQFQDYVIVACEYAVYRLHQTWWQGDMHLQCLKVIPRMPDPI